MGQGSGWARGLSCTPSASPPLRGRWLLPLPSAHLKTLMLPIILGKIRHQAFANAAPCAWRSPSLNIWVLAPGQLSPLTALLLWAQTLMTTALTRRTFIRWARQRARLCPSLGLSPLRLVRVFPCPLHWHPTPPGPQRAAGSTTQRETGIQPGQALSPLCGRGHGTRGPTLLGHSQPPAHKGKQLLWSHLPICGPILPPHKNIRNTNRPGAMGGGNKLGGAPAETPS